MTPIDLFDGLIDALGRFREDLVRHRQEFIDLQTSRNAVRNEARVLAEQNASLAEQNASLRAENERIEKEIHATLMRIAA
jgi:hypothetical protein